MVGTVAARMITCIECIIGFFDNLKILAIFKHLTWLSRIGLFVNFQLQDINLLFMKIFWYQCIIIGNLFLLRHQLDVGVYLQEKRWRVLSYSHKFIGVEDDLEARRWVFGRPQRRLPIGRKADCLSSPHCLFRSA